MGKWDGEEWCTFFIKFFLELRPFKRILSINHEVKKNTQRPYINLDSIINILKDFWGHIFLSST